MNKIKNMKEIVMAGIFVILTYVASVVGFTVFGNLNYIPIMLFAVIAVYFMNKTKKDLNDLLASTSLIVVVPLLDLIICKIGESCAWFEGTLLSKFVVAYVIVLITLIMLRKSKK